MQWCNMNGLAFKKALYSVPDPDPKIRGGGGGGLQKTFFPPFEHQFGLKIRGGGAVLPSPEQLCNKA